MKTLKRLPPWGLVFMQGGLVLGASAQTTYLDELVVTGTREERTVLESPVRTEVVTAEEIRKTHARDLREALRNVPGVQLKEIHGKSGFEVWLQGLEADQTLVLIDGMPMIATTGSSVDVSQLSVQQIERIEVVKGAVSAQYGSAGMGGVINVITRPIADGWKTRFGGDAGSYGADNPSGEQAEPSRFSGNAMAEAGDGVWGLRVAANARHSDGIDPEPETWQRPGNEIDRTDLSGRLEWKPADAHRLVLEGQAFREDAEARFMSTGSRHGKDEEVRRWRAALSGSHRGDQGLQGGWLLVHENLANDTWKYTASASYDDRKADMTLSQASGHIGLPVAETHRVQAGIDLRRETLDQTKDGGPELDGGDKSRESTELWLQDTWMPTEALEIVPGVRAQRDSDFGYHTAPKINARLDLADGKGWDGFVRAGVGAGYRVPNLKERHFRFDHSQLGYVVVGNTGLEPEQSVSYQLGLGAHYQKRVWGEANAFFNGIDDLIQTRLDPSAGGNVATYRYSNVDEARTWGLESTAGWNIADGWSVTAGYTWTNSEDRATGRDLNRRPEHQANLGLDGQTGLRGLSWTLRVRHQSAEFADAGLGLESPGYTTADLKLNYLPVDWLTLYGGVDNLGDVQRDFDNADEDLRPVEGRFAYLGFSMAFDSN
ncbi:MAG: TonB-dependent receptor plug domain-containing protein [Marinobacter sp.]